MKKEERKYSWKRYSTFLSTTKNQKLIENNENFLQFNLFNIRFFPFFYMWSASHLYAKFMGRKGVIWRIFMGIDFPFVCCSVIMTIKIKSQLKLKVRYANKSHFICFFSIHSILYFHFLLYNSNFYNSFCHFFHCTLC